MKANAGDSCPVGPPPWRYRCLDCMTVFEMPAAKGPSEEKTRVCPKCGGRDIRRSYFVRSKACPPGG